jgi:TolA-binding protein
MSKIMGFMESFKSPSISKGHIQYAPTKGGILVLPLEKGDKGGFSNMPLYSPLLKGVRGLFLFIFILFLTLFIGCAPSWSGKVVYLEDGKLVIQPESAGKIKSGQKVLIYRQKTITHPVTGEELGMIRDDIAEVPIIWVRDKTVTAMAEDPWFDMMAVEDSAKAVRGSTKALNGSVSEIGKIADVDTKNGTVKIAVDQGKILLGGENLTVIKYSDLIIDLETEKPIAIKAEPVAVIKKMNNSIFYEPVNPISWVEVDDIVVKRDGDMIKESKWFQDIPDNFSETMLFRRDYLKAIRYYNSEFYKEAIVELNTVIQANPKYEDTGYLMGMSYAKLNRYDEAIKFLSDYLNQNQNDAKALIVLAYIYQKQGKLAESAKAYEKLTNLMPKESQLWVDLGDMYQKIGDKNKAENAYKKALDIDPNNEEAKFEWHYLKQNEK